MIAVIDYGMGNLCSVQNALNEIGAESVITSDPAVMAEANRLILPGVGAFADCMKNIREEHLDTVIRDLAIRGKKPLLGICLGMQMLYEGSEENGFTEGFGFLRGICRRMDGAVRVPQIGWNLLEEEQPFPAFGKLSSRPFVYYVHSYRADGTDDDEVYGSSLYGDIRVPGLVGREHILGCQFHPEKSGPDGLALLKYFTEDFYDHTAGN